MMASSILNTLFDNVSFIGDRQAVCRRNAWLFSIALQTLQNTASQSLGVISNRVTFPVFSQLQHDRERFRSGLRKAMTTLAFAQFPIMIGLAAVAKPLILFLLTEKWAPCIPLLQMLCFAGLLYPIHLLNLNVLLAMGRSDLFFKVGLIKKVLAVIAIVVTYQLSIQWMVAGMVVTDLLSYFVNSFYTKKFVDYSIAQQLRDLYPYFLSHPR